MSYPNADALAADLASNAAAKGASLVGTIQGVTAQTILTETREGAANLRARTASTAAALEALSSSYAALTGYAGDTHDVETAPYLTRSNIVLRGNGATLHNNNATAWATNPFVNATLPLGTSDLAAVTHLTFHTISSVSENAIALGSGHGASFATGDLVYLRGATKFTSGGLDSYRNTLRARVLSVAGDIVTLDRLPSPELVADTPTMGNTAEGVVSTISGQDLFFLYRPEISDFTLKSDLGEAIKMGGIIDGTIRDLRIEAINGFGLGGVENLLVENISFLAHRKIAEIAENSHGVTYRTFRGSLVTGAGSPGPFYMQIGENSRDCVMEDFVVSSGAQDAGSGNNACALQSGAHNIIRNSRLSFPSHTGSVLAFQANAASGNPADDSGFENLLVNCVSPLQFFTVNDGGAGINRCWFRNLKFFGTPSARAGYIGGNGTIYDNVWCEHGAATFITGSNMTVVNCYFPDGFTNLTPTIMRANNIHDPAPIPISYRQPFVEVGVLKQLLTKLGSGAGGVHPTKQQT
jgi:hypothetical protein